MWITFLPLVIALVLLLVLSMVWPPDSPWAPWWRTSDEKIREALKLAKVTKDDIVYDLGCGDGRVLVIATKEFGARCVGIEIDPLRFLVSSILLHSSGVSHKVQIKRKNFFAEDLSPATVVFLYLVPKALARLKPKLQKELRPGSRIIIIKYEIDLPKVTEDKMHSIGIYKIS